MNSDDAIGALVALIVIVVIIAVVVGILLSVGVFLIAGVAVVGAATGVVVGAQSFFEVLKEAHDKLP